VTAEDELNGRIGSNLASLRARINAAAGGRHVELVAVTKGQGPDIVRACLVNGLRLFGENYADELVTKANDPTLAEARWTYQGRLQTNKINRLRPYVTLWQTLDTAGRLDALASRVPRAEVLVQINVTGSEGQGGVAAPAAHALIDHARTAGLRVLGVMAVGPDPARPGWVPAQSLDAFAVAVTIADRHDLAIRSLGMSADLELAVRAGATMVRVGTALTGPRVAAAPSRREGT
jgi:PLP dependent protein